MVLDHNEMNNKEEIKFKYSDLEKNFLIKQKELEILREILSLGTSNNDLKTILEQSLSKIINIMNLKGGAIYLFDKYTNSISKECDIGISEDLIHHISVINPNTKSLPELKSKNQINILGSYYKIQPNAKNSTIVPSILIPIFSREEFLGLLNVISHENGEINPNETEILVNIGKQLGCVIEKYEETEKFLESEEKSRILTEESSIGILIIQDNKIKYANEGIAQINEFPIEELVERPIENFFKNVHADDREKIMQVAEILMSNKKEYLNPTIFRIFSKLGKIKWLEVYTKNIQYLGKSAIFFIAKDRTDKIEAENKLKESESHFKNLTEQSLVGITIFQDGELKYVNESMSKINEYTIKEMMGWTLNDILKTIISEDRENIKERFKVLEGPKYTPNYNYKIISKSGKIKYCNCFSKEIQYKGKKAILTSFIDISDQKIAEIKLKRSELLYRNMTLELQTLNQIITLGNEEKSIDSFLQKIKGIINESFKDGAVTIHLYDEKKDNYQVIYYEGIPDGLIQEYKNFISKNHIHLSLVESKKAIILSNLTENFPKILDHGINSIIAVCIFSEQKYYGILTISSFKKNNFSPDEVHQIIVLAEAIGSAIKKLLYEEKLRQSEEKYRGIFHESIAPIYVFDKEKKFIDSNQAGLELLGYSKDELLNFSISDLEGAAVLDEPAYATLMLGDKIENYIHNLRRKDGKYVTVLNNSRPLTNENGKIVGMQSTIIDISDRIAAEENLKESEEKYRLISENISDLLVIINENNEFEFINNDVFQKSLGYVESDLLGKNIHHYIHLTDLKKSGINNIIQDLIKSGDILLEARFKHKNGFYIWLEMKIKRFYDRNGQAKALILASDISERRAIEEARLIYLKDLEEEVNLKSEKLEKEENRLQNTLNELNLTQQLLIESEKLASVGLLAAGIAHEINNPLMGIINYADILDEELEKNETINLKTEPFSFLKEIIQEGDRISNIVNGLLSFSRQDSGSVSYSDTRELINSVLTLFIPKFRQFQINVTLDFEKNLPRIPIRVQNIQQVLINVLQNSIDALYEKYKSEKDSKSKNIEISVQKIELKSIEYVKIRITDNGIGIEAQDIPKVFDPFFTTKQFSKEHGVGLGLSISYGIIKAHKGIIDITSKKNEFTIVEILLPLNHSN